MWFHEIFGTSFPQIKNSYHPASILNQGLNFFNPGKYAINHWPFLLQQKNFKFGNEKDVFFHAFMQWYKKNQIASALLHHKNLKSNWTLIGNTLIVKIVISRNTTGTLL